LTTCPICHLGVLKEAPTVFIQFYGETLIHAPNVPAWKCDVCGETFFDPEAVRRIDTLIGDGGPPPNRHSSPTPDSSPAEPDSDHPAASPPPLPGK
jgi:YgiT-type zinc finger domain-containing protein